MMHRVECGGVDDCTDMCGCRCHDRCGVTERRWNNGRRSGTYESEPCFRLRGHRWEHRSRFALENRTAA